MNRKYELLKDDTIKFEGKTLYRIKALKPFGRVKVDALGGYIESESNLSQQGKCWVFEDAKVMDKAYVSDNALIFGDLVRDRAFVGGDSHITRSTIEGDAELKGVEAKKATIYGKARITYSKIIGAKSNIDLSSLYIKDASINDSDILNSVSIMGDITIDHSTLNGEGFISYDGRIEINGKVQIIESDLKGLISINTGIIVIKRCQIIGKANISGRPHITDTTMTGGVDVQIYGSPLISHSQLKGDTKISGRAEIQDAIIRDCNFSGNVLVKGDKEEIKNITQDTGVYDVKQIRKQIPTTSVKKKSGVKW